MSPFVIGLVVGIFLGITVPVVWALCVASGRADDIAERNYERLLREQHADDLERRRNERGR